MTTFLSVKDAAQKFGKSPSSIRRLIYPILEDDGHEDRRHIEPNPEESRALRVKGENFAWRVSEEFLARHLEAKTGGSNVNTTANKGSESDAGHSPDLVQVLREQLVQAQQQLKVKDDQIASLSEITKSLNDRLREGNILMGSLQQQFAIAEKNSVVVAEEGNEVAVEQVSKSKPASPKKGWLRGIFR